MLNEQTEIDARAEAKKELFASWEAGQGVYPNSAFDAAWEAARQFYQPKWVSISGPDLPEATTIGVLLQCENSHGKIRVFRANYYRKFQLPYSEAMDFYSEAGDYQESSDSYFAKEGWYEECDSEPDSIIYPVTGKPMAWQKIEPYQPQGGQ